MSVNTDVSDAAELIEEALQTQGAPTAGIPIFWAGAVAPQPLPDAFLMIEPLYVNVWRSGVRFTNASHVVQVRAAARIIGVCTRLRADVFDVLPRTVFGEAQFGPLFKTDEHYNAILTVRTITAPERK